MTKILINALSATTGGALSVSRGLTGQLSHDCRDWEFELLCWDPRAAPSLPAANLRIREIPRSGSLAYRTLWEQAIGPRYARSGKVDAWLLLSGFVPFGSRIPKLALWQNAHIWTPPDPRLPAALRRKIALQRIIMRRSVTAADMNVFLSRESLTRCAEVMRVPPDRSTVIPLGLEQEWLERGAPIDRTARDPLLVMIGDLYPHKGYDLALRALARLAPSAPTLRLAIAGAVVNPDDRTHLGRLALELGIADRVDFLGKLAREDVARLYERGIAYIAASRLETFGLTPLESMACGLPVVSARMSASPEICGDAAAYFDPYAPEALADAVATLLASESKWTEHQAAGLRRVRSFGWSEVSARYRETLAAMLGGRTR